MKFTKLHTLGNSVSSRIHRSSTWLWLKRDVFLIAFLLIFSGITHGWNMTHYPYFENDEADYFSQAYSFLSQGKLAPYTYWYDHAPFGWIFTSGWIALTGGLFTFGFSLNSARVFMLVIHIASTFLLYRITKKITGSSLAATLTVLLFSISPLAVYFQRRLLLDNLMTFWLLLSLHFLLYARQRLWFFFASAICFGLAALSKENAVFFLPLFLCLVIAKAHPSQRLFAGLQWFMITGMVVSFYPLYAIFKQELFPTGTFLGGTHAHVSLLDTLKQQAGRGSGLPFWKPGSDFLYNYNYWLKQDALLMIGGSVAFVLQGLTAIWRKPSRILFFFTLSMLAFLMSGKLVINFYVIPLVPLFAMCIGNSVAMIVGPLWRRQKLLWAMMCLIIVLIFARYYIQDPKVKGMFVNDETTKQVDAINWIKKNVPPNSNISMDYYGNLDLKYARFKGDPVFPNADWYWKVDFDPDIRVKKLADNFKNVNYILVTPQLYKDASSYTYVKPLTEAALNNSTQVAYFGPDYPPEDTLGTFVQDHPNGNWAAIYKQNSLDDILNLSWQSYKTHFINGEGRVVDPTDDSTQVRDVGYTLLRAVLQNDQTTFQQVWSWTNANMMLPNASVFASRYGKDKNGQYKTLDTGSTSDGDELIAFSLALAGKNWSQPTYTQAAQQVVQGIWSSDTAVINGSTYLVAGTWTAQPGRPQFTLNPSEFMPQFYPAFAKLDPNHPWLKMETTMYSLLDKCSSSDLGTTQNIYLTPNWCDISQAGTILPATDIDQNASNYSYEAFRSLWNISLDALANNNPAATTYLQKMSFLSDQWHTNQKMYALYTHAGDPTPKQESLDQYVGSLGYFVVRGDQQSAQTIYDTQVSNTFQRHLDNYYWSDPQNIFEQNWAWLNVWLLRGNLATITY